MEQKTPRINYIACFLLALCCVGLSGELDVMKIENNISELRKSLDALPDTGIRQNVYLKIRRDPFVSLIPAPGVRSGTGTAVTGGGEEKKTIIPGMHVSGIVFDSKLPLAIIGTEVKKEGESIGEFEVYRIEKDKVLIKHGEEIFPFEIER